MSTHTETGTYYWRRSPVFPWRFAVVRANGEYGITDTHAPDGPLLEMETSGYSGEWGPRIPGPEQLAAMREMAETDPTYLDTEARWQAPPPYDTRYGADLCHVRVCGHCNADPEYVPPDTPSGVGYYEVRNHAPDCPWLRAQESGKASKAKE